PLVQLQAGAEVLALAVEQAAAQFVVALQLAIGIGQREIQLHVHGVVSIGFVAVGTRITARPRRRTVRAASAAALRISRCLSLSFNDIFEPSVSRRAEPIPALTDASPGSARSPGRRVRRRLRRPPTTAYTLSSERKASRFFAKQQCEFT